MSDGFFPFAQKMSKDKPFEGPEILANLSSIGGLVPADGQNIEKVKDYFVNQGMIVGFLHKDNRLFSQH